MLDTTKQIPTGPCCHVLLHLDLFHEKALGHEANVHLWLTTIWEGKGKWTLKAVRGSLRFWTAQIKNATNLFSKNRTIKQHTVFQNFPEYSLGSKYIAQLMQELHFLFLTSSQLPKSPNLWSSKSQPSQPHAFMAAEREMIDNSIRWTGIHQSRARLRSHCVWAPEELQKSQDAGSFVGFSATKDTTK